MMFPWPSTLTAAKWSVDTVSAVVAVGGSRIEFPRLRWGDTGVRTKADDSGGRIGPPAERE
jgi:hypothetical protein